MKPSNEPECEEYPHQKVKKPKKGTATKRAGQLLPGVRFLIEHPFPHTIAMPGHTHTSIITSESRSVKFAFDHDPSLKEMRTLWKAELAKRPGPSN